MEGEHDEGKGGGFGIVGQYGGQGAPAEGEGELAGAEAIGGAGVEPHPLEFVIGDEGGVDTGVGEGDGGTGLQYAGFGSVTGGGAHGDEGFVGEGDACFGASVVVDGEVSDASVASHLDAAGANAAEGYAAGLGIIVALHG